MTKRAKFDITTATKPVYAGVGVTDLAVERVREYVSDVQKSVRKIDLEPQALAGQAATVVNARVDAISKDAKARRTAVEKRVAELQAEALALPGKLQASVEEAYGDLVTRGETLVTRIRKQESTKATTTAAKTTTAKAKTTKTQATTATKSTAKKSTSGAKKTTATAKKSASTAKKTAAKKSAPVKSSAKATTTAATKTAAAATEAVTDAAAKVGD
jgi:hypothetical protein